MEEMIARWKELNSKADRLLDEHKSFKQYNSVRLKMDNIESALYETYGKTIEELIEDKN